MTDFDSWFRGAKPTATSWPDRIAVAPLLRNYGMRWVLVDADTGRQFNCAEFTCEDDAQMVADGYSKVDWPASCYGVEAAG